MHHSPGLWLVAASREVCQRWWNVPPSHLPGLFAIKSGQDAIAGSRQRQRFLQDRIEHRSQLARVGIDHRQHLGHRGLAVQRRAQLGEQAHVLDGDDGLGGEGFEQRDLARREGTGVRPA